MKKAWHHFKLPVVGVSSKARQVPPPTAVGTYQLLPGFIANGDEDAEMTNGWNTHLEIWLLDIQRDANTYFCMLDETAACITRWKWVFIILYAVFASAGVVTTAIAMSLSVGGIWLPIVNICIAGIGALVFTIFEALGFNEWANDCKSTAGDFSILGRRIETQKRIPRSQRLESGIKFSNAASMRFEELRTESPAIIAYIRKKYTLIQSNSIPHLKIPLKLLEFHQHENLGGNATFGAGDIVIDMSLRHDFTHDYSNDNHQGNDNHQCNANDYGNTNDYGNHNDAGKNDKGKAEVCAPRVSRPQVISLPPVISPLPVNSEPGPTITISGIAPSAGITTSASLQELFQERLLLMKSRREEQDDLARYENYVRAQYAGGSPSKQTF